MSLKLDYLKVYPIIEQNCQANQIIAQMSVSRDDENPPHIRYKKFDSEEEVYNYISVNDVNGTVYLTIDGVNAINEDHADPSQDIQSLKFKVVAYDYEIGDELTIDVEVAVVRVHDEPPQIIEEVIYDIYQDDAIEGKIVLDVRTLYPAYFFVADDNYDNFQFTLNNFGRLTITNAGVDYIQSLDPDETTSIDIKIEIKDQQNAKVIYKTYTIPIKKGSALQAVPKKAILEQVAQYLGNDLAFKIERLNQIVKDLKNMQDYLFDFLFDTDKALMNSFDGTGILNYIVGKEDSINISGTDYEILSENEFKNYLQTKFLNLNETIEKNLLTSSFDLIKYNQENLIDFDSINDLSFINSNKINFSNISPRFLLSDFFEAIKEQIDDRIQKVLNNIISNLFKDMRTEYWDEFERLEDAFLKFKLYESKKIFQQIMRKIFEIQDILWSDTWSTVQGYASNYADNNHGLIGKVSYNEDRIDTIENTLWSDSWSTVKSKVSSKNNGLIGRVWDIDERKLEDWGDISGWNMTTSGTIQQDGQTVLDASTTSVVYLKGTVSACLSAGGVTACMSSNGTFTVNGGNGTVNAAVFTGTANKAKYADLAEYYETDKQYEPGTLLMIGGEKEVTEFKFNEGPYIGIVSEKPGFVLNSSKEEDDNWIMIALRGRVKVKLEKDLKVKKGQALYASEKEAGVAGIKENQFFVGYVLKDLDDGYALIVV